MIGVLLNPTIVIDAHSVVKHPHYGLDHLVEPSREKFPCQYTGLEVVKFSFPYSFS